MMTYDITLLLRDLFIYKCIYSLLTSKHCVVIAVVG